MKKTRDRDNCMDKIMFKRFTSHLNKNNPADMIAKDILKYDLDVC